MQIKTAGILYTMQQVSHVLGKVVMVAVIIAMTLYHRIAGIIGLILVVAMLNRTPIMPARPTCYHLVGLPGSGKSTWISKQKWISECHVISPDRYIELEAMKLGKTFSDIYTEYIRTALGLMYYHVRSVKDDGKDIVWEQTNTTIKERKKRFKLLPGHDHIAVVFCPPALEELKLRLANRTGREVPLKVLQRYINNWDPPTKDEGFKEIWVVPSATSTE